MDQERERIQADLRGLLHGSVRCDNVFTQMYASDGSIFEVRPLAVVRPRGTDDVVACLQYATENRIPIHARGAGSGQAGESLGPGIVLDFSHTMRRLLSMDAETVRVQPGIVVGQLNRHLARQGRMFGPDPAWASVTTVGSALAIDAAGSHWLKYGSAREHVEKLQIVLADGQVMEVGRQPLGAAAAGDSEADANRNKLVGQLADVLGANARIIDENQPKSVVNRCGYRVSDVLTEGHLDVPGLLVGSEGTLAVITEATVRTAPVVPCRGVALLLFDRLDQAAHAALEVPPLGAAACDLLDRRLLSMAREADVRYDLMIPRETESVLLVEIQGDDPSEVRDRLNQLVDVVQSRKRLAFDARIAVDPGEVELFWRLVQRVAPTLYRLKGYRRALPFVEDVAVPPEQLPDFLVRAQNVLKKHQVTASMFVHAGHGQLHLRPFLDLANPEHLKKMLPLATALYSEVLEVGGSISGEHGDGLSRSWFVRRQYGPLYEVFRKIKRIFDPEEILNPGKIVGGDETDPFRKNLRPVSVAAHSAEPPAGSFAPIEPQLAWNVDEIAVTARICNGCGQCRTMAADSRMCPIFRFAGAEEASPRAKANLMRAVITGRLDPAELTGDTLKSIADLCVNCHQCRLECPARVDIPKLMVECKGQYAATNGLRPTDSFMTRLDRISAFGSLIAPVTNWAISNYVARWLMEKMFGIAQGRKLPRVTARSFLRRAHRRRLTRPTRRIGRKVLFFVDVYANWYDVELADAMIAVLEHNGVGVYVHPRQRQAGMAMISLGALDRARDVAAWNIALLADAVRQGYHIVTTEPAAALCLSHEYPNLFGDEDDARLVAENSSEACTYLWRMHQTGKLELDFSPVNAVLGYHMPCHMKALQVGSPGENLLRLVPGLSVTHVEKGCSGMAGTFGLKRENYRSSLRAGWRLISALRDPAIQLGVTECSSCKIQMEQGTTKPTIHPLKILALSYGLMPQIARHLTARGEELVVT